MNTRRGRGRAVSLSLGLLAILTWSAPALSRPQGDANHGEADDYFRQGKSLVGQGKLEDAYRAYLAGYRLKKGYDIAGNLGNVELELGKPRDAAEHLAFCLKNFPATGTAKQLEFIRGRFAEARREVASLRITVSVDGAELLVDGRSIGRSPLLDEVFVDPGSRTIEARLHGHNPARRSIEIERGASAEVVLAPRPLASREDRPASPAPPAVVIPRRAAPALRPWSRSPAAIYAGLSGIVVGVGVGVAGLSASNESAASAAAQREALARSHGLSACSRPENQARCENLDGAYRSQGTFRALGIAGFATAGAASIATVMFALTPSALPEQVRLRARLLVAPGGASFGLLGRF
jgi:hypothetical protein